MEMPPFNDREEFMRGLAQGQIVGRLSAPWIHFTSMYAKLWKSVLARPRTLLDQFSTGHFSAGIRNQVFLLARCLFTPQEAPKAAIRLLRRQKTWFLYQSVR